MKLTKIQQFRLWLRELECKMFGCIKFGAYYGMPQSHCRRCGKRTNFAANGVEERCMPWNEYAI